MGFLDTSNLKKLIIQPLSSQFKDNTSKKILYRQNAAIKSLKMSIQTEVKREIRSKVN